ncbi:MAG TPA: hypothetical protein DCM68_04905 [Verrucomicrobia bacterium]|nr:hypothetical protein [Verrucomicrobiota bacterium]
MFWRWMAGCAGWAVMACGAPAAEEPAVAPAEVAAAAAPAEAAPAMLKHAVVCPPFKGDPAIALIYHAEVVKILKSEAGVEYLEGARALARRAPVFTYRVNGSIVTNEEARLFVLVTLTDEARKEQIASHVAPASTDPATVAGWVRTMQASLERRASRQPFECRVRRRTGQESVSLDRGLGSGLQPGMVLYLAADEEPLLSPVTGEVIGLDSPRALGQIEVFRVMEDSAYARPVPGTKLPRASRLHARTF